MTTAAKRLNPAKLNLPPFEEFYATAVEGFPATTREHAQKLYDELKLDEVFLSEIYQVNVHEDRSESRESRVVHISIKRRDKQPITDWRDMQDIKNQILGPECEAVELYPAESRLVDTANQFHLWGCRDNTFRFPFGFNEGRQILGESKGGAVQRPFEQPISDDDED